MHYFFKLKKLSFWSTSGDTFENVKLHPTEGGGQAVKYKTESVLDHSFSKHPLNKDFFHAKKTN